MKTYVKIALFVVSFIALSAILAALYMFNLKQTDMAKAKPDFIISATELEKQFEDNESTASARYINKILEVTGTIGSITLRHASGDPLQSADLVQTMFQRLEEQTPKNGVAF